MGDWTILKAVVVFATGIAVLFGVCWQAVLSLDEVHSGRTPSRFLFPLLLAGAWAVSVLCWQMMEFFHQHPLVDVWTAAFVSVVVGPFVLSVLFGLIFTVKCYFGPLLVGTSLAVSIFRGWEHRSIELAPVFSALSEWISGTLSPGLQAVYFLVLLVTTLGTAATDSLEIFG